MGFKYEYHYNHQLKKFIMIFIECSKPIRVFLRAMPIKGKATAHTYLPLEGLVSQLTMPMGSP